MIIVGACKRNAEQAFTMEFCIFSFNSDRCVVRISHRFKHRKTLYERESICFIVNPIVITVLMHIFGNVHLWIIRYTQCEIIEVCFVMDLFFFFNFDNAIYRENKMKIIKWWQIRFFFFFSKFQSSLD